MTIIWVFIGSLIVAMALGTPIAFSLMFSGVVMMLYLGFFSSEILAQNLIFGTDNFPLMAIPFFMLAGEIMNRSGITQRIIGFASALVGHVRGGLGYVAIIGSVMFAGLSGSAVADTAALGSVLIPMMAAAGYNKSRSAGLIAAGGVIAPVIPPSVGLILFGVMANVSITKLFMGGIVPGLMIGLSLAVTWAWLVRRDTNIQVSPRKSWKEILVAVREAAWALMLPVIIIGGLRGGIFTPTESAVVAVFYTLFVAVVVYRTVNLKAIYECLYSAAKTTSVVMLLVAASMIVAWLIAIANIPATLASILAPWMDQPLLLMFLINFVAFLVGTAMDFTPTILILTPVLIPIVQMAGIDPVYFGVIFILNCSIGLLTPPVGAVLNVAAGVGRLSLEHVIRGVTPFLIIQVVVMIILILFPSLITVPVEILSK